MTRFKRIAVAVLVGFDVFVGTSLVVPTIASAQSGYNSGCIILTPPNCGAGICNGGKDCKTKTITVNGKSVKACRCV